LIEELVKEIQSLEELVEFVRNDDHLVKLKDFVAGEMVSDPGHDFDHCMRVALWTCKIGAQQISVRDAIAAALCHDLVNVPKNSPRRRYASLESAQKSAEVLAAFGFKDDSIVDICNAIRDHSFSAGRTPNSHLGCCLQDADRLDALGAIGVMRNIATGVQLGAKLFHQYDPWAVNRSLDDVKFSVDHYFTKLFKLPDTMLTPVGKKEAQQRIDVMKSFLDELARELVSPRN
jgi:uncharacterized protein